MYYAVNNTIDDLGPVVSGYHEPVSAAELYDHLQLNCGLEVVETQLQQFITAARLQFENDTDGRILQPTLFHQHLTLWPKVIELQRGPVIDVEQVAYFDVNDDEQLLEAQADISSVPGLVWATTYPAVSTNKMRPITVVFTAGYETAIPEDIRLAILLLAGTYYEYREAYGSVDLKALPMGWQAITDKYKTGLKGF